MAKVTILVGISGSGKTTWAANYLEEHLNTVRINRDDIRRILVYNLEGYYKREDVGKMEGIVTVTEGVVAVKARLAGYDLVIDNTNLKREYVQSYLDNEDDEVKFKLFDTDVPQAKLRVMKRDGVLLTKDVEYINKQTQQYLQMKKWILENHKEKVLTE